MIQKKICMLGAFGVGKTSLVSRYVHSLFSEKYLSTVGVKIDKKTVPHSGSAVTLMLWDLYGEDNFQKVQMSYLRGTAGFLLVVDGTRSATLTTAMALRDTVFSTIGRLPYLLLLNKNDMRTDWEIRDAQIDALRAQGEHLLLCSAKTGEGVEDAFRGLTEQMLKPPK